MRHKLELRILHDNVNGCIRRRNEALEKESDDIGDIRSECQEATRKGNFGTRHTTRRRIGKETASPTREPPCLLESSKNTSKPSPGTDKNRTAHGKRSENARHDKRSETHQSQWKTAEGTIWRRYSQADEGSERIGPTQRWGQNTIHPQCLQRSQGGSSSLKLSQWCSLNGWSNGTTFWKLAR